MRLILSVRRAGLVAGALAILATLGDAPVGHAAFAEPPRAPVSERDGEVEAADPDAVLGELVVTAAEKVSGPLILPKIGVLDTDDDARRVRDLIARDLDLSGEFEVVQAERGEGDDALVPWRDANARFVVRVDVAMRPDRRLDGVIELVDVASGAVVYDSRRTFAATGVRDVGHEFADRIIEAVTGDIGPFRSRLTFVAEDGKVRRVHVVDPDGGRLEAVSPVDQVALAPAFGPDETIYYLASVDRRPFRLFREGSREGGNAAEAIDIGRRGSLYGLAFGPDRKQVAIAIATGNGIQVMVGDAAFSAWDQRTDLLLALHPSFGPRHQLAYAGTRKRLQRIYVGRKAVSLPGLASSSPTFCDHPSGTRLVYSVGVRKNADIVVSEVDGSHPARLTRWRGRNSAPACSPDGRLIAFFSTRTKDDGPGLYVMRLDGRRPKKIADVLGHSLQWSKRVSTEP